MNKTLKIIIAGITGIIAGLSWIFIATLIAEWNEDIALVFLVIPVVIWTQNKVEYLLKRR